MNILQKERKLREIEAKIEEIKDDELIKTLNLQLRSTPGVRQIRHGSAKPPQHVPRPWWPFSGCGVSLAAKP